MARRTSRTIRLQTFVRKSPKKVFKHLSDPERLTGWFVDSAALSLRKGGRYRFAWADGPVHTGKVLEYVRGHRLTLTWQWPGHEALGVTRLKISVEPKAGGSVVKFVHSGFLSDGAWVDLYDGAIQGWTYFLMNLKSVVQHGNDLRSPFDW